MMCVMRFDVAVCSRLEKMKEFEAPTQVNSSSLHPDKDVFVSGGEDFKMYKFDYITGAEIGESPLY